MSAPLLFPIYRPRASALHAAGAGFSTLFCLSLALTFVVFESPVVLLAGVAAVALAAWRAGVGEELRRAARLGLTVALLVAVINPLVSTGGATLVVRGWEVLGHRFDVTLEALAYGGVAGVRILGLVLAFALFSAVVDPDELLRLLRRVSYRSALTAALATRLVPVLARDASRRSEAARCRATPPGRVALAHAALAGSLERASEMAAALEVRGYARAGADARRDGANGGTRARASRHDRRVAAAGVATVAATVAAKVAGIGSFAAYPRIAVQLGPPELALAAVLVLLAVAPFAGAGGRLGAGARTPAAASGRFDG